MKKASQIIFIVCFLLVLAGVLALTLKNYGSTVSDVENRTLTAAPEYSAETMLSGEYFSGWESFLIDRAAGRNTVVKANTFTEMNLLRLPVVNSIYVSDDFLLPISPETYRRMGNVDKLCGKAAADVKSLSDYCASIGVSYVYAGIPSQIYYYRDKTPDFFDSTIEDVSSVNDAFFSALEAQGVSFVNADAVFETQGRPESYYTQTDHHYSFEGAFAAYTAVMEKVNEVSGVNAKILTMDDLSPLTLQNPFMGSRNRELFGLYDTTDKLTVGALRDGVAYTRFDNGLQTDAPILGMPKTTTELATYGVFMGGDFAETIVKTDRPQLPKILIYGDSFSNALESLIYASFDEMCSLDLRFYKGDMSLREYIADYKPDVVVCVRDCSAYLDGTGNGETDAE